MLKPQKEELITRLQSHGRSNTVRSKCLLSMESRGLCHRVVTVDWMMWSMGCVREARRDACCSVKQGILAVSTSLCYISPFARGNSLQSEPVLRL